MYRHGVAVTCGQGNGASATDVEITDQDGVLVAVVTGEIDMTSVGKFHAGLQAQLDTHPVGLVVHLDVSFLGAHGLAALVELHGRARIEGVAFVVVATAYPAVRPIIATALDQVFPLAESVPVAVTSILDTWDVSGSRERTS